MKNTKKPRANSNDISPIDNPTGAIDFYMPLPDDVYKKWNK